MRRHAVLDVRRAPRLAQELGVEQAPPVLADEYEVGPAVGALVPVDAELDDARHVRVRVVAAAVVGVDGPVAVVGVEVGPGHGLFRVGSLRGCLHLVGCCPYYHRVTGSCQQQG